MPKVDFGIGEKVAAVANLGEALEEYQKLANDAARHLERARDTAESMNNAAGSVGVAFESMRDVDLESGPMERQFQEMRDTFEQELASNLERLNRWFRGSWGT